MGYPTWMYKLENGEVISQVFDSDDIPKGWSDNCYALTEVDTAFDDKDELEAYAKEKYGVDIDKRKKLSTLIKEVQELGNG